MLHHHVDHIADARARLDAAWHRARLLADGGATSVDGTRERAALASAPRSSGIHLAPADVSAFVDYALAKFAQLGLLMPEAPAR